MAPVVLALQQAQDLEAQVLVSAQHRELLDQVLAWFGIRPDADLDVMVAGQRLTHTTTRVLEGCERVFGELRPDLVLVHGDTTTTLAAALAAYYARIPVGHVEAGLRTGDKYAPYPEELNRRVADAVSDLHFAPTAASAANLRREGTQSQGIYVTGNTSIDALLQTVAAARPAHDRRLLLVEAHRRESFGQPMENIVLAVRDVVRAIPDLRVIYSVHPNPNVTDVVHRFLDGEPRVELRPPLDYPEWSRLMAEAHVIASDSGGVQEEAPALGTPVVLLREKTERPEAVEAGTVVVAGTDRAEIGATISRLFREPAEHQRMSGAKNPFGDGQAARRTVEAIRFWFGLAGRPPRQWRYRSRRDVKSNSKR